MKSLSLFSGCMGLDLGLENSGIKTVAFVDRDKDCRATVLSNRPKSKVFDDVFDEKVTEFAIKAGVDLIAGGPPCQPFSSIGKKNGFKDERSNCFLRFFDIIEAVHPTFFVMENVAPLMRHDKILNKIIRRMKKNGYKISKKVVNTANYGMPQSRKRFIMIGSACGSLIELPAEIQNPTPLHSVISDLEDTEDAKFSEKMFNIMSLIPPGGCWRDLPETIIDIAMGNANRQSGGLTSFYRRLDYSKPSPTLVTSPTQRATTLCHPKYTRPLSIAEYKRIQGFDDSWTICGNMASQYRQLGNAVPVRLGEIIGEAIGCFV